MVPVGVDRVEDEGSLLESAVSFGELRSGRLTADGAGLGPRWFEP